MLLGLLRPSWRLGVLAGRLLFLLLLLLQLPLCRPFGLLIVGGQAVVDVFEQALDARGVGAEVVAAEARGRAHVDFGALVVTPDSHGDIFAEPHNGGSRHRLDYAVASRRLRGAAGD